MELEKKLMAIDWNSSQKTLSRNLKSTEFHIKHINYLDSNNNWINLKTYIRDEGSHFFAMGGLFMANLPKFADEVATFNSELRYDIFKKERFTASDMQLEMRALDASHVVGHIDNIDVGMGAPVECVIYPQAFPAIDADLIYYIHHGRAPRMMKIIRFNGGWKPSNNKGTTDVRFSMNYSEESDVFIGNKIPGQALTRITKDRPTIVKGNISNYSKTEVRRGIGIKSAKMWSSIPIDPTEAQLQYSIDLNYQRIDGQHFILTKKHPNSILSGGIYPLFSDTTTTAYPDASPETTTCDGFCRTIQPTWAAAQNNTSADQAFDDWTTVQGGYLARNSGGSWFVGRGFLSFDTSAVGTDDISDGALDLWLVSIFTDAEDAENYIAVVEASPASNTAVVVGDFDVCGDAIDNPTQGSDQLDVSAATTGAYNTLTLDPTGIGWINKTGITNLGIRNGADMEDNAPGLTSSQNYGTIFSAAEETGTSQDPKLTITHAPTAVDPTRSPGGGVSYSGVSMY